MRFSITYRKKIFFTLGSSPVKNNFRIAKLKNSKCKVYSVLDVVFYSISFLTEKFIALYDYVPFSLHIKYIRMSLNYSIRYKYSFY
jgi:hypothetical protein